LESAIENQTHASECVSSGSDPVDLELVTVKVKELRAEIEKIKIE
jgi:hypothetical protein